MNHRTTRRKLRPATLRVGGALEILTVLKTFGEDPNEVLAEAGINPELFADPDNVITYSARDRLFKHCVARTGCQHFGLLVGKRMTCKSLGLVGLLAKTSRTAGTALRCIVNFLHLHSQGAVMTLKVVDDLAVLTYDAFDPELEASNQTGYGAVAMMHNIMSELCGPDFEPTEAAFAHRKPTDVKPFRRHFSVPLYFDAEHNALLFSKDWLDIHPPGADEDLRRLLQAQINALEAKHSLDFPQQVRAVLRSSLLAGHCSEEGIASLFSMHSHTLNRRLQKCGTGFHDLVDECRFEIAQQMLENTSLSVSGISTSLGYSRASSFIRAFRRWSGTTPAQWRAAAGEY